ncbi:MAG TPA: hypothetical protein VNJ70_08090 [Thermoanaerobaculia bacterium]|nr:hypothetical protein [Thermoanaerobaculia bacterium]
MTIDDSGGLTDRLYADALAADLRVLDRFIQSRTEVAWGDIESHVRERAAVHRKDLSTTPAEAERAFESVRSEWRTIASGDGPLRGIVLLARAAGRLLQPDGREMILRVDRDEPGREILRWRFVSLALPPGILLAAATQIGFAPPEAVRLLDPSIAPDFSVAHNHVHHAAMMSFEELWASLRLRALLRPGELVASLRDKRAVCPKLHAGECPSGRSKHAKHMAEWGDVIRQAFIAGRVLDRHSYHSGRLADCRDGDCRTVVRTTLRAFLAGRVKPHPNAGTPYPWPDELTRLGRRFRDANAPAVLRRSHIRRTELIREQTAEERSLLARVFAYLLSMDGDSRDLPYETLFAQYLRVKSAVFGLLVHPAGEQGLATFFQHFQQIKVYAPESNIVRPRLPHDPVLKVRATEYRVAPDAWFKILRRHDIEIEEGVRRDPARPEAAWLVHFKRERRDEGLPLFGSAIRHMEGEADQIVRSLVARPTRLRRLRGIDICGVEEAQPLWVSAPTLRWVRNQSGRIAGRRPGLCLAPLRLTIHAGEDFRWLTSGMRAIAEPFQWKLIERGDRIGHGIAITLDPRGWWRRREGQVIIVKRFDRLLDLAFLAEYAKQRNAEQEEWLREEIRLTVKALRLEPQLETAYATEIDVVKTARDVWKTLGGRSTRRLMQTPPWRGDVKPRHERWISRYLWTRSTQSRAEEQVRMRVDDDRHDLRVKNDRTERDLLEEARGRLIHEVARWQVCIESNPSSNLVVSSLDAMAAQDFLQLRPTRAAGFGDETLTWTISTDDPITFSTTLADEYAYAWAGMVLRKENPYDPAYARALLDEAAATSMRMRFTVPHHEYKRASGNKR